MKKKYLGISFTILILDANSVIMESGYQPNDTGHDEDDDFVYSPW